MRWLDGITKSMEEFQPTLGDSKGQGSLMYCSLWRHRIRHDFTAQQEIAFRELNICKGQR